MINKGADNFTLGISSAAVGGYWGCPIKTVNFNICGIYFSHIDEFLSSNYVENTNDRNCDLSVKPEIVISRYKVTNEEIYI